MILFETLYEADTKIFLRKKARFLMYDVFILELKLEEITTI